MLMYDIFKAILWFGFHILFRIRLEGLENIPQKDGALICPNHFSWADPLLVAVSVPRRVRFMAKYEAFKIPVIGFLLKKWGVFPVRRGEADLSAIKTTIKLLKDNELVGLFPEGTRIKGGNLGEAHGGVAVFSIKSARPVVPVLISGNYRLFSKVRVIFGKPVNLLDYKKDKMTNDDYLEVSQIIMSKIKELKGEVIK